MIRRGLSMVLPSSLPAASEYGVIGNFRDHSAICASAVIRYVRKN